MLEVGTILVPVEDTIKTATTTSLTTLVKAKAIGLKMYVKHALVGGIAAIFSFSTALAMQPISAEETKEYHEVIVAEATTDDLQILTPYMDADVLSTISFEDKTPAEIIIEYVSYDSLFKEVVVDYFSK